MIMAADNIAYISALNATQIIITTWRFKCKIICLLLFIRADWSLTIQPAKNLTGHR